MALYELPFSWGEPGLAHFVVRNMSDLTWCPFSKTFIWHVLYLVTVDKASDLCKSHILLKRCKVIYALFQDCWITGCLVLNGNSLYLRHHIPFCGYTIHEVITTK